MANNELDSVLFFAVSLPDDYGGEIKSPEELVFRTAAEALAVAKKAKGSRFKSFTRKEDAITFASDKIIIEPTPLMVNDSERSSIGCYKSPPLKELVALRRLIEQGNYEEVKNLVWTNPRFLISSSSDTAVLLMEGPRYNSAHIASKSAKADILRFILATVTSLDYIRLMYPTDDIEVTENRSKVLLACYLNTPDKGAHDTPLHFACKFGAEECLDVLLSYPQCDTEKINKLGKKAIESICERKGDNQTKERMLKLFENRYFVPVIREDDGTPKILPPCRDITSPQSPIQSPTAYAGPMSPQQAEDFYGFLKSPVRKFKSHAIILSDHDKGVERVARAECRKIGVRWAEFWPFLDSCLDLASVEGLTVLEKHLAAMDNRLNKNLSRIAISPNKAETKSSLMGLCEKLEALIINTSVSDNSSRTTVRTNPSDSNELDDSEDIDYFSTAPTSPIRDNDYYVFGAVPNKWDKSAAIALQAIEVDSLHFPHVKNWLSRVTTLEDANVNAFTPRVDSFATRSLGALHGRVLFKD
ncbi:Ankyrin repeat and LEM domain-containing protein 2 [Halotydeus destructor]|nr:Ankyrin repeat and LEM domain-containing protein 2 [Halotydeus destructor]